MTLSRRAFISAALVGATGVAGYAVPSIGRPQIRPYPLEGKIPLKFGAYSVSRDITPVIPDLDEQAAVARAYENTLVRAYTASNGPLIMLVIAHGQPDSGMLAIHRPEICYAAQGFSVEPIAPQPLGGAYSQLETERLFAEMGDRQEPVLYWAMVAREQTDLGIGQKLRSMRVALAGQPMDSFLVRISTIGPNNAESFTQLADFARAMLSALDPVTRADLAGAQA